jgi:DNA repair protein RadC
MGTEDKNIHKGHRERFRQRFLKDGIESFSFHEKIEFLLFYAKPQVNTNEDAHILANGFNDSIVDIFEAEIPKIIEKGKTSINVAIFIKFLHELIKDYNIEKLNRPESSHNTFGKIKENLIIRYSGVLEETVRLLSLNNRMEIIEDEIIHIGSINSAFVSAGKIARTAFIRNAAGVILAHNHPDGIPVPSMEDIATTKRLKSILGDVDINLIEHYIIAGSNINEVSFYL